MPDGVGRQCGGDFPPFRVALPDLMKVYAWASPALVTIKLVRTRWCLSRTAGRIPFCHDISDLWSRNSKVPIRGASSIPSIQATSCSLRRRHLEVDDPSFRPRSCVACSMLTFCQCRNTLLPSLIFKLRVSRQRGDLRVEREAPEVGRWNESQLPQLGLNDFLVGLKCGRKHSWALTSSSNSAIAFVNIGWRMTKSASSSRFLVPIVLLIDHI